MIAWKSAASIVCAFFVFAEAQQSRSVQEDPCKTKNKLVADATYCDRYWECIDGQPELYDCPNGLVFAGKNRGVTEGCDYPWRANYCEDKQLANGPITREHCDWLYGIFGHESSCTRYWTCWNGTATEQLCIGGLLYNEITRSCDWPENVDGCQKHPLCNAEPNGNVPLGKSCNRYWQCQGGYPRLQRCPAMLVFDKRSLRCVVPPTEDCDAPTTPPPSADELQEADEESNLPPQQQQPQPLQQHHSQRPNQISQARPASQQQHQQQPQQQQQQQRPQIQAQRPQQFQLAQQPQHQQQLLQPVPVAQQQSQSIPQQRREEAYAPPPGSGRSRS